MNSPTENQSKKIFVIAIKRTNKKKPEKILNSLLFYNNRSKAEEYATQILIPDEASYFTVECVIYECELYHCGNPLAFINNTDCFGIPNFIPSNDHNQNHQA